MQRRSERAPKFMKSLRLLIFLSLAPAAFGQFRVTPAAVQMAEGGAVNLLVIESGRQRFCLRQPPGFNFRVDARNETFLFRSADEKTAVSVQFTTNFPGQLAPRELLRSKVLAQTPGAGIVQSAFCPTGYKPACFFDLVRVLREGMSVRFRHVYAPSPEGAVELVFATDDADFESQRFILSNLLNSFQLEPPAGASLVRQ
jgi:hypothetical protein